MASLPPACAGCQVCHTEGELEDRLTEEEVELAMAMLFTTQDFAVTPESLAKHVLRDSYFELM